MTAGRLTAEELIKLAMSELGKRKSERKTAAARENGKKGGAPKGKRKGTVSRAIIEGEERG